MAYYDGAKLLSLKDINGLTPEIFICTTNRTGGKTTFFGRLLVNRFLKEGKKFMLVYRFTYELDGVAENFFKDIGGLFFPNMVMTSVAHTKGVWHELFLDGVPCGYAVALNSADEIKRNSHFFSDTDSMLFDEFQSETNHYCTKEISKFQSIHTSVARGQGKQTRYVPVYMLSNPVTLINPYYVAWGISSRLSKDTKFMRGDGFVIEQGFVESASTAFKESGFNRAFAGSEYNDYASEANVYLNDNVAFIDKPEGHSRYIATLKYEGKEYGIREYADAGFIYCDNKADVTYPFKITVTTEDHGVNYVMLRKNDRFISNLRFYFSKGCFRFKDLKCKEVILKALSY